MDLTPQAKKLWSEVPEHIKVKLLNNVWCSSCGEMRGIGNVKGFVDGGDLILQGICTKCGKPVARVIEGN